MLDENGSISVEMTALILSIMWVTFFIMMTAFYMYDLHRLQCIAENYLYSAVYCDEELSQENFVSMLDDGFFYLTEAESQSLEHDESIVLIITGVWKCPLQRWLFFNDEFIISDRIEINNLKPAKKLKIINSIIKGLGG